MANLFVCHCEKVVTSPRPAFQGTSVLHLVNCYVHLRARASSWCWLLAPLHGYLLWPAQTQDLIGGRPIQTPPSVCPHQSPPDGAPAADGTYWRPRFSCDARDALLPLMAHGPGMSWDPWRSSCSVRSLGTFWTKFSSFSWL